MDPFLGIPRTFDADLRMAMANSNREEHGGVHGLGQKGGSSFDS